MVMEAVHAMNSILVGKNSLLNAVIITEHFMVYFLWLVAA